MRFSVWPINQQPVAAIREVVLHADATGWDGAWMADHLMASGAHTGTPVAECWTTLTLLAADTRRVRLGTLVASVTFRPAGVLARMAGTLAEAAPGRLVLGLGAGWQADEHAAYGIPLPPPAERLRRLDETCHVVRRLLEQGTAHFDGRHLRLAGAALAPRPEPRLPILVGAKGDRALRVVARHADEWNLWADAETLRRRHAVLRAAADEVGRDVDTISVSAQAVVLLDGLPHAQEDRWRASGLPLLTGSVAAVQDAVGALADAGLDELVVPDFSLGTGAARLEALDRILTEVAAPFRGSKRNSVC